MYACVVDICNTRRFTLPHYRFHRAADRRGALVEGRHWTHLCLLYNTVFRENITLSA